MAFISPLVLALAATAFAPQADDYYADVDASSPARLRVTLHEVIDDHVRVPYTSTATDTWDVLEEADQHPDETAFILDLYKNATYARQGGGNTLYQREHSWPRSYGFPDDGVGNYPYTDCHHLFLCNSSYNGSRSNKPYDIASAAASEKPTEDTAEDQGYPGTSNWAKSDGWETWVGRRGDVARALFYLDVRYEGGVRGGTNEREPDLILTDNRSLISASNTGNNEDVAFMGMLSVLVQWHREDPVDEKERHRNEAIHAFQGNRNPFIDHPEWVDRLFGHLCTPGSTSTPVTSTTQPFISELHYDNAGPDTGEFVEITGPAGTDLGGWMLVGYNGNTNESYKSIALAGVIPGSSGTGALGFEFSGLQNGAPDGIALVAPSGTVVEFLSYEGVIDPAGDGPAAGLTSQDIGVREDESTESGHSLQRSGSEWHGPRPQSRGEVNP